MSITKQIPNSAINFSTWVSPSENIANYEGVLLAQYIKGGYQNVITLEDRDAISIYNEGAQEQHTGFTNSGDGGKTTGLRTLGMMVKVLDPEGDGSVESKVYILVPRGYFGNNGNLGWDSWSALPEWEKAKRMKPSATVYTDQVAGGPPPLPVEYTLPESQTEDDCWVELIQFTEHPLPSGGSAGELLAKVDSDDHNVAWVSPTTLQGPQGERGEPGIDASIVDSFIGNLWTHPLTPGNNGVASGLAVDGPVEINEGDMFSITVGATDDASSAPLNGTFIAKNSWTHPQAPNNINALQPILDLLLHYGTDFEPIVTSFPQELQETSNFTVTVSSNSKFEIDGVEQKELTLMKGQRYIFDLTSANQSTHPFLLSATEDGTHNGGEFFGPILLYQMVKDDNGDGVTDRIVLDVPSSWPDQLFYYCSNHPGMGGTINLIGEFSSLKSDVNISTDTPPATQSDPGTKGDIRFDLNYMYICVEQDTWRRIALDTSWNV